MKIIHFTAQADGGAGIAVARLNAALLNAGVQSTIVTATPPVGAYATDTATIGALSRQQLIYLNKTPVSNTHFSLDLFCSDTLTNSDFSDADIVHLHWIADWLTPETLLNIRRLNKPVVWTLHDLRPLTGGCHFSAGCDGFHKDCTNCPQLAEPSQWIPPLGLQFNRELVHQLAPHFIAPSQWIKSCVHKSSLGLNLNVTWIPNGVDTMEFRSFDKDQARLTLGIPQGHTVVLLAANNFREKRKGADLAHNILRNLTYLFSIDDLKKITLLTVGNADAPKAIIGLNILQLGILPAGDMPQVYAASDVLLFTSLEDNLPNILLEAQACGLPCIAGRTGGIPEILEPSGSGILFDLNNPEDAAQKLFTLITDQRARAELSQNGISSVLTQFSSKISAGLHIQLYNSLKSHGHRESPTLPTWLKNAELRAAAQTLGSMNQMLREKEGQIDTLRATLETETKEHAQTKIEIQKRDQTKKSADIMKYWKIRQSSPIKLGVLHQYDPKSIHMPISAINRHQKSLQTPAFCILTPSFNQGRYIERTIASVLEQNYPKVRYGIQDGASTDATTNTIYKYKNRLAHMDSRPDEGQSHAINFGFSSLNPQSSEIMGWLNSDDLLLPGTLDYVGDYFARHPKVDVIYGHRIIIDSEDREIGRWFLPRHDDKTLKYADYVPQETLFWRASAYQKINGLDSSFRFAMDWDFLLRLEAAGCIIVRLPRFLGCFRVHEAQKTSSAINDIGALEMSILRTRIHGRDLSQAELHPHVLREVFRSACVCRLWQLGLRY